MTTNEKYGSKLIELKKSQKEMEGAIYKGKEEIKSLENGVKYYKKGVKRTILCLLFSILITAVIIMIMVHFLLSYSTSITVQNICFFGGICAIYIINYVNKCIAEEMFFAFDLLILIPPFVVIAPFVWLYNIIVACKDSISDLKSKKSSLNNEKYRVTKNEKKLNDIKYDINEIEGYINNANSLYDRAISENDLQLMKKAADEGNADAIKYFQDIADREREAKAAELYKQATSGDTIDKELLKQAAELGHELANLYIGKDYFKKAISDQYTKNEKNDLFKNTQKYFKNALNNIVCEVLYMFCCMACEECEQLPDLHIALARARKIEEEQLLPKTFEYNYDYLIKKLVRAIDDEENSKNVKYSFDFDWKKVEKEYNRMLGRSDEPSTVWVDINTGLPY